MTATAARVATLLLNDPSLGRRTRQLYAGILLPFLDRFGDRPVGVLRREDVEGYLAGLTHLGVRTHQLHQAVLHRLFGYAVERGLADANPAAHLRRRKPDPGRGEYGSDGPVRHLTKAQVQTLLRAAEPRPRLLALLTLLHESGARVAEVLALSRSDVDFDARQFAVVGKGNKRRWCFFGEQAEAALRAYLGRGRHHPHPSLFTERGAYRNDVRPLSYATAYRELREAVGDHASLKGVCFHSLRHTFATGRAGVVPLEVLRALLGHESIQTTLVYQKVTSSVAGEAARAALAKLAGSG